MGSREAWTWTGAHMESWWLLGEDLAIEPSCMPGRNVLIIELHENAGEIYVCKTATCVKQVQVNQWKKQCKTL